MYIYIYTLDIIEDIIAAVGVGNIYIYVATRLKWTATMANSVTG